MMANWGPRLFQRGQYILEFEDRFTLFGSPGKFRLAAWDNQRYCGNFAATLANPFLSNPVFNPGPPNIAATRETRLFCRSTGGGRLNDQSCLQRTLRTPGL
jgi:high affinity Mn2+ porin